MSGLVQIQHGSCINSAATSGYLFVKPDGGVRCSRGCEDVPSLAELYSNREDREQIVEHHDGGLYVQTED